MKKSTKLPTAGTNHVVKGYKVFNSDFKCRDMQYEENKEYKHEGTISICNRGLHFCLSAQDCFKYYDFNPANIVCEIEARGKVQYHHEDSKGCTDLLFIVRRLTWEEVLRVANTGLHNSGHSNSGNWNSGNWNSGNSNSGYRNSGYRNSGDRNSGNWNSGNWNSGNWNSGNWNSGDRNSGDRNSGNWNSGNWNSGDRNSGDSNSGYRNSGNWNSGDRNSGDSNSGYRNSGAFCTDTNPVLYLFDKPTNIGVKEWENHKAVDLMYKIDFTLWIPASIMTEEEKKAHPKYETTEGYLKTIPKHEAWANFWHNLSDDNKEVFTTLPNFDPSIFEEITGIKLTTN